MTINLFSIVLVAMLKKSNVSNFTFVSCIHSLDANNGFDVSKFLADPYLLLLEWQQ